MNIYIVCTGEPGEGHSLVSAHETYASARSAAAKIDPNVGLQRVDEDKWLFVRSNGVDEIWIYRLKLQWHKSRIESRGEMRQNGEQS
jgi:hypothetical protein